MKVTYVQRLLLGAALSAGVLAAAVWHAGFGDRAAAATKQPGSPVPTVSVTTLPAMPGPQASYAPPPAPAPPAPTASTPAVQATPNPIAIPPAPPLGIAYIQVVGDVEHPLTLTLKDLEHMRSASLTLRFHVYTGVPLTDVIRLAHPRFSSDPQTLMRKYVFVQGLNGQSAIVSFPEFTKQFNGQLVLLAYMEDLRPLTGHGFVQLVVQDDNTSIRYIRIARIVIGEPLTDCQG
jgi:DMSO/TMAO reductase YedYZ molybdopterin-dependent catalytic subunit